MKCIKCGLEMSLEEYDYDNPYIQGDCWVCDCGQCVDRTSWGQSDEWEEVWYE